MKEIVELSTQERDIIASTWALKLNRPKGAYDILLRKLKDGYKPIDEFPLFVVKILQEMKYRTPLGALANER